MLILKQNTHKSVNAYVCMFRCLLTAALVCSPGAHSTRTAWSAGRTVHRAEWGVCAEL